MKKILYVTAVPETVNAFLTGYLNALSQEHEVHLATTMSNKQITSLNSQVIIHDLAIARAPQVFDDMTSLIKLIKLIKRQNFDAVHSFTPKAGLLAQTASIICRVKYRFHTFTGQVWATRTGLSRTVLKCFDKYTAALTTACLADSPSQRDFMIKENIVNKHKCTVLAHGSISGINIDKFNYCDKHRTELRSVHHIDKSDFVFLYVGRLKRDKGIIELIDAFKTISKHITSTLVIIGSDEEQLLNPLTTLDNVQYLGFKSNIQDYYSFADVLLLPSHREGFGNVIIEAAACQLPAIASNIYGLSDAIEHNKSGLLHQVHNSQHLAACMLQLYENKEQLSQLSQYARKRVEHLFDEKILIKAMMQYYSLQFQHNTPSPQESS